MADLFFLEVTSRETSFEAAQLLTKMFLLSFVSCHNMTLYQGTKGMQCISQNKDSHIYSTFSFYDLFKGIKYKIFFLLAAK